MILSMLGVRLLFWVILWCLFLNFLLKLSLILVCWLVIWFSFSCVFLLLSVILNYFLCGRLLSLVWLILVCRSVVCVCVKILFVRILNLLVRFFLIWCSCIFLIFSVCLFFFILLWVNIWMLIIVLWIELGICRDVFLMLDVFLLKIVCSSFFFGVSCVLFLGVILFIRMLLFFIFVLM